MVLQSNSMVQPHSVTCPKCGYDTGYTDETLLGFTLFEDLVCPNCGHVIIPVVTMEC